MNVKQLPSYFLRGCLVLAPLVATVYIIYLVFTTVDQLMPVGVPGLGFVLTIALITLVGFLTSNVVGRTVVSTAEHLLKQVPLVKLVYTSLKDLVGAVVGNKRRFNTPVAITLGSSSGVKALGFVTRQSLQELGIHDHVAVYLPQSYNFAGNLLLVSARQVEPLQTSTADLMTFIVSGGVTGLGVERPTEPPGEAIVRKT